MADITVEEEFTAAPTKMVGRGENVNFRGIFGGGHTLTLDYSAAADYAAPFRFVDGATIRNLTVAGTITTSKKFAAGIIGQAAGIVTIDHCCSRVTINSSIAGDGTHGGLVGIMQSGETTISGSLFDGRLLGQLTDPGSASADDYAQFEYKIPEYADGELTTHNVVFNGSVTIEIPAGTYDWCITNSSPAIEMIFIASAHGNIGGRKDNYVFEAGKHYEFNVSLDGDYDRVDVIATPMYGEWTQQTVSGGELATLLSGLAKGTKYVVQVQAVMADGKTSEWSPVVKFTTLESALLGDVNEDGEVTIADVTMLVNVILGNAQAPNADVNADGTVTIADVTSLVNMILQRQ